MGRYSGSSRGYHSAFRGNNESYFEDLESLTRALVVHPAYVHTLQLRPVDSSGMQTRWGKLPLEVLLNILSFLDSPRDLARLELVNSSCRVLANDKHLWRRLCVRDFNVPLNISPSSWKELYRFNRKLLKKVLDSSPKETSLGFFRGPIVLPLHH
ncbi:hypothetical protein ACKKBG_A30700 [Auxenochlorella protothecoides x Auxenochlorella symbiontica]